MELCFLLSFKIVIDMTSRIKIMALHISHGYFNYK